MPLRWGILSYEIYVNASPMGHDQLVSLNLINLYMYKLKHLFKLKRMINERRKNYMKGGIIYKIKVIFISHVILKYRLHVSCFHNHGYTVNYPTLYAFGVFGHREKCDYKYYIKY